MYDYKKIETLALEEGLNDRMIAEKLGCDRVTVTRIRKRYNIPKCNINNRKDKSYVCAKCNKKVFIKRCEPRKLLCEECLQYIKNNSNN